MATLPAQYYNRFDPSKNVEEHRFIAGRGLQSAELNEIQKQAGYRLKGVADALFKDGDVIRDAAVSVDADTGFVQCSSGAIYLRGAVRGVIPATFTIPVVGAVAIGVRLLDTIVTHEDDPTLLDPATGTRNYNQPGAERLETTATWGWGGDGGAGDFYPVYEVVDGLLSAKERPPNLDAFTQALARYDRDSAGGMYIVSGLTLRQLPDDALGRQVYSLAEGRARVYGYGIEFGASRRVIHDAVPDLKAITNEPHLSTTAGAQRINLDRSPAMAITQVALTSEKTVTLTHGVFTGAQDVLPDTSVLEIIEVKQGGVTFVAGSDYNLTAGKVDWTPAGSEPAPGSTYTCKYRYITNVTPTAVDDRGFTVTGAVSGTLVLVDYSQKMPRIDRLCLTPEGETVWLVGVAAEFSPQPPSVPVDLLPVASIYQTWRSDRRVDNDGVRVVTMTSLAGVEGRLDRVLQLIAQQRLESNIHTRESGTKKGLFTDPFLDDSQRDAGIPQSAAVVRGELILPIDGTVAPVDADVLAPTTIGYLPSTALEQPLRTGSMKINPYMTFSPVPARVTLTPAVDRWTVTESEWTGPTTARFVVGAGDQSSETTATVNVLLSSSNSTIETLRPIDVRFEVQGFGPGEAVSSVGFDGIQVVPSAV